MAEDGGGEHIKQRQHSRRKTRFEMENYIVGEKRVDQNG